MKIFEKTIINLCAPDMLSICSARESLENQKHCKFYSKATYAERCMHFVASINGHCDSVEAQRDGRQ